MAATKRRSAPARRGSGSASKAAARATGKAGSKTKKAAESVTPSGPTKLVGKAAKKALKVMVKKAAQSGAGAVRAATERGAGGARSAVDSALSKRLPIQVSVDVAVPLSFAWEEWMTFEWMTEGLHRIVDVERDGDELFGELAGPRSTEWVAEIVDERAEQSFAWRSVEGTDCAGLITFHRLSDRLTRIELDLDVLPTNPAEAASMTFGIGRRRAEAELRRFKAHVEFINPDVYESDEAEEPEDGDEAYEDEEPEDEDEGYEDDETGEPEDEDES
jgi:uncharacterized membrane protein